MRFGTSSAPVAVKFVVKFGSAIVVADPRHPDRRGEMISEDGEVFGKRRFLD